MTSCADSLGPGQALCAAEHCSEFSETNDFQAVCQCVDWQGNAIPDCSPKDSSYPVVSDQCRNRQTGEVRTTDAETCNELGPPWYWQDCYCCCACVASGTPVAIPGGNRAIGDIMVGDQVLAASAAGSGWQWGAKTVSFSSGTPGGAGAQNVMVYIRYGDGDGDGDGTLIATPDQLFLQPGGKLIRADRLRPGLSLIRQDGSEVPIVMVAVGNYQGGIHHIATDLPKAWNGSVDGHLLSLNGIIGGDYVLQIFATSGKADDLLVSAPQIGTPEYAANMPELLVKPYVAGANAAPGVEVHHPQFSMFRDSETLVPDEAFRLFSDEQEALLLGTAFTRRGFSDTTNLQMAEYHVRLLGAFFPGARIHIEWENQRPNLFAFESMGEQAVLVSGELLRLGLLRSEAIAMAMAFGIASRVIPADHDKPGPAMRDGINYVMHQAYRDPSWRDALVREGASQWSTLLDRLAEIEDRTDPPALSADCLRRVIAAVLARRPLPHCAMSAGCDDAAG